MPVFRYLADTVLPAINAFDAAQTRQPEHLLEIPVALKTLDESECRSTIGGAWYAIVRVWRSGIHVDSIASAMMEHLTRACSCSGVSRNAAEMWLNQLVDTIDRTEKGRRAFHVSRDVQAKPPSLFESAADVVESLTAAKPESRYLAYSRFAADRVLTKNQETHLRAALSKESDSFLIRLGKQALSNADRSGC
jgi:hypothetical protein